MTTTKINQRKKDAVDGIKALVDGKGDLIFADFRGLKVTEMTELRDRIRETEADFKVVKNNYTQLALKELGMPDVSDYLFGPTAIAVARNDPGPTSKVLFDFGKNTTVQVKGGIVGGRVYTREEVLALSRLPDRKQMLGILLGTVNAPLQKFMSALNGITQKLVRTLQAVADSKAGE